VGIDFARERLDGNAGGSPSVDDLVALWDLCTIVRPTQIVEIGTWIGVSARVMFEACGAFVVTCDKRPLYVGDHSHIEFHPVDSTTMLRKLVDEGFLRFQFCFIDASLRPEDPALLAQAFGPFPAVIAVHDMNMHNGLDNMRLLRRQFPEAIYSQSPQSTNIGILRCA
jgi:hypothetical protein